MGIRQNQLISRLENFIRTRVGIPQTWVKARLIDREFTVRKGTIHAKEDYDEAWILALAMHAQTAIDVGSNIGQAAFILLYPNTVQEVILVEPNPGALSIASENLIHNHLVHRARLVCAFAADIADEAVQFWTVGTGSAGSMYADHAVTAAKRDLSYSVPTTTVDTLCDLYHLIPDLVKVDTEGAESLVLPCSTRLSASQKTRFFVEMHSNPHMPMTDNARKVLDWCAHNAYRAWYCANKEELTDPEQIAHRGRCHLLLQPGTWEYPDWLRNISQSAPLSQALT